MTSRKFLERGKPGITGERKRFWECEARFQIVAAGRRSGKSVLASWKLERKLYEKKPWSDPRYFYAAPTHGQAKRIAWERFKQLIPSDLVAKINESELRIKLKNGAELWIIGLEVPQRMEGIAWDGGIIDERADIKAGAWDANLRPALADRNGFCWHVGVPDFQGPSGIEYKSLFDLAKSGTDREWEAFTWCSADVLPEKEIESAKRRLPPMLFRQEFEASFESAPGRAYQEFVYALHVAKQEIAFTKKYPLIVSCDFNFGHHNWGLYQYYNSRYVILQDLHLPSASVGAMISALRDRMEQLGAPQLLFYGDYSGEQHRAEATTTAWREVRDAFPQAEFHYKRQPPIADRISAVNTVLRSASGEIRVTVNPNARNHIRDFEKVTRTMLYTGDKSGELTHASDAFGYFVHEHQKTLRYADLDLSKLRDAMS